MIWGNYPYFWKHPFVRMFPLQRQRKTPATWMPWMPWGPDLDATVTLPRFVSTWRNGRPTIQQKTPSRFFRVTHLGVLRCLKWPFWDGYISDLFGKVKWPSISGIKGSLGRNWLLVGFSWFFHSPFETKNLLNWKIGSIFSQVFRALNPKSWNINLWETGT